ncbi:glycosyltransferase family 4 protein [Marivita sp. S0852]|uniref:glycosyltransferase family 4 protein n=1 Tax=Marivita sp. S0852 TaxID=3373893 RepID=UPI003982C7CE
MRGAGIKLPTIVNSPASAHLLDLTRTVSRARKRATGIDRIERAYLEHLIACDTALYGLVRTKLGYLLLDQNGCAALLEHSKQAMWHRRDLMSRVVRRTDMARAVVETGLRKLALDRATPSRLRQMLQRHLPEGSVYMNVGQTNVTDRVIHAVQSCNRMRWLAYVHDTIPLDWPDTQTGHARIKFKRFLTKVARNADIVLCNSNATRRDILRHAPTIAVDHVHVVLPGIPDIEIGQPPAGLWSDQPYFVAIGTLEPRKNIGFLLDLWADYDGPTDPHLILIGQRGWLNTDLFKRLDQKPANIHECPNLADSEMWALLKHSNGLLFPSLAEGFGYPAFEAAQLNVPLVCNPLSVFKELLKEYPIYAGESDRYSWRNKIEQLMHRHRGQSGEQYRQGAIHVPSWQGHFNQLFTRL